MPRQLAIAAALVLLASACSNDSADLGDIIDELDDTAGADSDSAGSPGGDDTGDAADTPSNRQREALARIGGDDDLGRDEERCILQGVLDAGLDVIDLDIDRLTEAQADVVTRIIFECLDDPASNEYFVEGFIGGFEGSAGFQIDRPTAECLIDTFVDLGIEYDSLIAGDFDEFQTAALTACLGDALDPAGDASAYGDDPDLDALYDECAAGDDAACDELYLTSPIESEYEEFGATCGNRVFGAAPGGCASGDEPAAYGDDPDLDALYDECAAGDSAACDELYLTSPIESEYERFGLTCGDTVASEIGGYCEAGGPPLTYGDDAFLDGLQDDCAAGDGAACDDLWAFSLIGSDYESFAATCGGRVPDSGGAHPDCTNAIGAG
ncbi:MAG: hypothetical protein ACE5GB_09270 [Acidimicrobiales bacterium]